jgi:hypothetical protein
MVILQSCLDVLRCEQESCAETCSVSSGDGKQFVFLNDDDVTVIKQQEDPEPTTSTTINNEAVVSPYVSMYPGIHTSHLYRMLSPDPFVVIKIWIGALVFSIFKKLCQ